MVKPAHELLKALEGDAVAHLYQSLGLLIDLLLLLFQKLNALGGAVPDPPKDLFPHFPHAFSFQKLLEGDRVLPVVARDCGRGEHCVSHAIGLCYSEGAPLDRCV